MSFNQVLRFAVAALAASMLSAGAYAQGVIKLAVGAPLTGPLNR